MNRVTSFSCSPNGKLNAIQDARTNGQDIYQTTFTQNLINNQMVTTITDPAEHASNYYHDVSTGNLVQFTDAENNSWLYTWSNNNLTSSQDAKGVTSYEYDANGNITKETVTIDSNSSNNIVKTMTYDQYNQLLTIVDGNNRNTSYAYSNKGDLISTTNTDRRESDGNLYDQYGNVLETSSAVSGAYNLLENGSMEIAGTNGNLLENWTRVPGSATATLNGFNSHGNSALKLSSITTTTDIFYQDYLNSLYNGDKLTLRVDVKLEGVEYSGGVGGAMIQLEYMGMYHDTYYCSGTGEFPLVVTSLPQDDDVKVCIGLYNASGTAWFDGVQLEKAYKPGDGYHLSAFNSVENSSFEHYSIYWTCNPNPVITSEEAWGGVRSAKYKIYSDAQNKNFYQDVPVYGGELLTLSGMVKTIDVNGTGAYLKVEFYDTSNQIISNATVQTDYATGTHDSFIRLAKIAKAPNNANHARVIVGLDATHDSIAYFDAIKLIPCNSIDYTYNTPDNNYIIASEDALNKTNNYTYNEDIGTIDSFSDAKENVTHYYYNNLNQLVQVLDPLTRNAYYEYDPVGNLTATRDPRSSSSTDNTYRTLFGYNKLNQLETITDPANESTVYTYDRAGNLSSVALPNGHTRSYTYDDANRLERKTLGVNWRFDYTYDGANNLIGVTDQDSDNYTWDYDRANRVNYSIDTFGKRINYQWDKNNNLELVKVYNDLLGENTEDLWYDYGKHNKLYSVILPSGGYEILYNYDESGRIFRIGYPGNNYRDISYQINGLCDLIQDTGLPNRYIRYAYEDNGNISTIISWVGTESFNYDDNGRLIRWQYATDGGYTTKEEYTYDNAGNRLTKKKYNLVNSQWQLISSVTYNYNNTSKITNTGFAFNDNGNMTSDGTYNYTYNPGNQLTMVRRVSDNSVVATYDYNYDGSRKSKTVSGVTTRFHWDAFGRMVRESDSSGNTLADYYYDTSGKLVGYKKNDQTYIYHDNLRGDIVTITELNGSDILAEYHYDPWGNVLIDAGYTYISQPFRYAGYYLDKETGLYYLKNRYYSPKLGRFLTRDDYKYIKYGNPQTLNSYTYAENNPVNNTDPSGHFVQFVAVGAVVLAPEEAALLAGLGAAAVTATVELADDVIQAWDWYWADETPGDNDVTAKDLRRLSNDEIESLGGEEGVREIKENTGKSKSDLFVRKGTKEIYSLPKGKRGAPPQYVMDLP